MDCLDADCLAGDLLGRFGGEDTVDADSVGHSTEAISEIVAEIDHLRDLGSFSGTPPTGSLEIRTPRRSSSFVLDMESGVANGVPFRNHPQADLDIPALSARLWASSAELKRRRMPDPAGGAPVDAESVGSDDEDLEVGCFPAGMCCTAACQLVAWLYSHAAAWLAVALAAHAKDEAGRDTTADEKDYSRLMGVVGEAQGVPAPWAKDIAEDVVTLLRVGKLVTADCVLKRAIAQGPRDLSGQWLHAWHAKVLAMSQANPATIIEECTHALEGNTRDWSALPLVLRARCYAKMGDTALAVADYERLLAVEPDSLEARKELPRLRDFIPDLYGILQVAPTATSAELSAAYRHLLLRCHPDRQVGQSDEVQRRARVKFDTLQEAYTLLSDPAKRAEYDEFRAAGSPRKRP